MTRRCAPLCFCLLLAAALVAMLAQTSAAAVRMAARGPLTEITICDHAGGASTVHLDRKGKPVDPEDEACGSRCAACVGSLAAVLPLRLLLVPPAGSAAPAATQPLAFAAPLPAAVHRARGPPTLEA
ncbi:hypothetical protein RSWS8N_21064 (plasmid) [Cereibacter sphaeroides WS8N]|uniref:DUF2946 family protein n=1 Tax=Cereibacter sphaeroides TaxID=1063 RepID=UPI00020B034D|nr:DUF2946 family protein [Cereibacter sphaeroides]EGJ19392.1 hypothetical protein RSWS8N_21064 [Cereibacter sphaeroides WS8N]